MALEDQTTWGLFFKDLPKVSDDSWIDTLVAYLENRINENLKLIGYFPENGNSIVLNSSYIKSAISSSNASTGDLIEKLASGLKSAVTLPNTLTVSSGSYILIDTPATKFSLVTLSIINSASASLLEAKILELLTAPLVENAKDSQFPVKIRDAFLLLTATISGTNSVSPTPGPLIDAARGVE